MPKISIRDWFKKNERAIVILSLFFISLIAFVYFYQRHQILLYGDALSRMNISRKIVDNLTPGLAQLGNVWLPLPQILMLPFVSNKFLWQTGIAGSIVSMAAFITGGYYLFKSAKILTQSFFASILTLSVYALNINILYLQTTSMSEALFLCTISVAIYYFLYWIESGHKMQNLIVSALAISAATLTRYEGLAILFSAIPMVFFYMWYSHKKYHQAESSTILFASLASLGFLFWTIYLTVIFGDPLYWKNYYAGAQVADNGEKVFAQGKSLIDAIWMYSSATVWMNGIIPTILALISVPLVFYKSFKQKTYYFLPIFLTFSLFVFMVLTLMRNTPIKQPDLTLSNLLNPAIFDFTEFNIRYGILMLPLITLLCAYLFSFKSTAFRVFIFALLCLQFSTYYYPAIALIFQMPINLAGEEIHGSPKELRMMQWMQQNYHNDGLIMISALKHDPQMFQMGADYKKYIHEGAGMYWKESQTHPQKYASWIVLDSDNEDDQVTKYLKDSPALELYYNRVYDNDGMYIYKIKTKPDIIVKQ